MTNLIAEFGLVLLYCGFIYMTVVICLPENPEELGYSEVSEQVEPDSPTITDREEGEEYHEISEEDLELGGEWYTDFDSNKF